MTKIQQTIKDYLDLVESVRSVNTHDTYKEGLRKFVEAVGVDAEISPETYIKFLLGVKDDNPASQSTYRVAVRGLYSFYADTHPEINLATLKAIDRRYAKKIPKRLPVYDHEAIIKVIEYCSSMRDGLAELRDRSFVLTLADTGLRLFEACKMKRGDLDWNSQRAVLIGKGDKQAVVRFSNRAVSALRDYLAARANLDGATGKQLSSLPLFARHYSGKKGRVLSIGTTGMWMAIKERIEQAGVDRLAIRIHDFRHYFVTTVYQASGNLRLAQDLARHEDPGTTGRYAHLLEGQADEEYNHIFNEGWQR